MCCMFARFPSSRQTAHAQIVKPEEKQALLSQLAAIEVEHVNELFVETMAAAESK